MSSGPLGNLPDAEGSRGNDILANGTERVEGVGVASEDDALCAAVCPYIDPQTFERCQRFPGFKSQKTELRYCRRHCRVVDLSSERAYVVLDEDGNRGIVAEAASFAF